MEECANNTRFLTNYTRVKVSRRISVSKQKILVVDDDPVIAVLMEEYLTAHGYETEVISSGTE